MLLGRLYYQRMPGMFRMLPTGNSVRGETTDDFLLGMEGSFRGMPPTITFFILLQVKSLKSYFYFAKTGGDCKLPSKFHNHWNENSLEFEDRDTIAMHLRKMSGRDLLLRRNRSSYSKHHTAASTQSRNDFVICKIRKNLEKQPSSKLYSIVLQLSKSQKLIHP
jgi:hypothetical protein